MSGVADAPLADAGPVFAPLGRLMVRTPLLPVEAYEALLAEHQAPDGRGLSLLEHPLLRDAEVRRALAVGSLSLSEALERPESGDRERAHREEKVLRYLIRMSTRPTPYGLFAGVALAAWGERTDLARAARPPRTRSRPDMEWLLRLALPLEARPEIRRRLRLVANPAAYIWAGRISLAERAPGIGPATGPVWVRATRMAVRALEIARTPVPYADLARALHEAAPQASLEKIDGLITELWQETLLLTDLRPPVTTERPAEYLVERLAPIEEAGAVVDQIRRLLDAAGTWDRMQAGDGAGSFRRLVAEAREGGVAIDAPLQVDLAFDLDGRGVTRAVADEVGRAAELLLRLTPMPQGSASLAAYAQAFEARYGQQREVPLLELLHPEVGLGPLEAQGYRSMVDPARAAARSQLLFDLACRALRESRRVVELDESMLSTLETCAPRSAATLPSLDLNVFVAATSAAAIDAGDFQVVIGPNLGANAAGRSFGRFADVLGAEAHALLGDAARADEAHHPDRLWAELVYLPRNLRSTNVTIRPPVRAHEMTLAVAAGVAAEQTIPLAELVVGIRQGRLYLRWPAAGKEVVPCAGHMLNTNNAPPVCRFLQEIGTAGRAMLGMFDWSGAGGFPYLPRVQVGRVVLALAQWRITARTRTAALPCTEPAAFRRALELWRDLWGVPERVYFSMGDNRLLLDLTVTRHIELLRAEILDLQDGGQLLLQEALPGPEHAWVPGPGGRYLCEFVVPMVRKPPLTPAVGADTSGVPAAGSSASMARAAAPVPPQARLRPLGSEWLFIKLYVPRSREEDLIAGPLWLFAEEVAAESLADDWFFIRYNDPDPHLRVRFRGDPARLLSGLLPRLSAWATDLMAAGSCQRYVFDTYDREIERYGGPAAIDIAESVFAADSRAVVDLLTMAPGRLPRVDRNTLALLSIDDLLAALGIAQGDRLAWYRRHAKGMWDHVGQAYRQQKALLRTLLGDPAALQEEPGGDEVRATFARRRATLAPLAERLAALEQRGELHPGRDEIYRSFVHMHCNRLLPSGTGAEATILGLLLRTWDSLGHAPQRRKDSRTAPAEPERIPAGAAP
jgi:thiopeptide-type bacteriocin biosynthesis protein